MEMSAIGGDHLLAWRGHVVGQHAFGLQITRKRSDCCAEIYVRSRRTPRELEQLHLREKLKPTDATSMQQRFETLSLSDAHTNLKTWISL
jgi:hypothetical protein